MKILFYDTETTGLAKDFDRPYTEIGNYPRLIQLAYHYYDWQPDRKILLNSGNWLIKPTFEIPEEATKINGITFEKAYIEGYDLIFVLQQFHTLLRMSDRVVCHNIKFDDGVMGQEFCLNWRTDVMFFHKSKQYCTKMISKEICKISDEKGGYKYPRLKELYWHFFKENFENQHTADADVSALVKCYESIENYHYENSKTNTGTQIQQIQRITGLD